MWETRAVTLTVQLPHHVAARAQEIQTTDPDVLDRIILYGLTRRWVYSYLREKDRCEYLREAVEPKTSSEA